MDTETPPAPANGVAKPEKKPRIPRVGPPPERTKIIETEDRLMLDAISLSTGVPHAELIAEGVRFLRDKYIKHK